MAQVGEPVTGNRLDRPYFSKDDFDRERYREVATIAQSMLASLGNIPIKRIEGLLSDFAKGHATPKIDVRGAVVEDGKVLLVREKSDCLWTLPGGFADIGLSATKNVIKEMWEEASIRISVTGLYPSEKGACRRGRISA